MRAVNVCLPRDWIGEFSHGRAWLDREHIEAGANSFRMNRFDQRVLINNFTARSVDEVRSVLHGFEKGGPNQRARVGLQSNMHADDVGFTSDFERCSSSLDPQYGRSFFCQTAAPGNYGHAEC